MIRLLQEAKTTFLTCAYVPESEALLRKHTSGRLNKTYQRNSQTGSL
jgi:hypothetical protein